MTQETEVVAIQPTRKMLPIFRPREEYPIVQTSDGERILLPTREYKKIRGESGYWRTLFLFSFVAFCGFAFVVLTKPPITVKEPFVVEKEVPVVVPSKCLIFCK